MCAQYTGWPQKGTHYLGSRHPVATCRWGESSLLLLLLHHGLRLQLHAVKMMRGRVSEAASSKQLHCAAKKNNHGALLYDLIIANFLLKSRFDRYNYYVLCISNVAFSAFRSTWPPAIVHTPGIDRTHDLQARPIRPTTHACTGLYTRQ